MRRSAHRSAATRLAAAERKTPAARLSAIGEQAGARFPAGPPSVGERQWESIGLLERHGTPPALGLRAARRKSAALQHPENIAAVAHIERHIALNHAGEIVDLGVELGALRCSQQGMEHPRNYEEQRVAAFTHQREA